MMYYCYNCNSSFEHPVVIENADASEVGRCPTLYCPICSDEGNIEEMDRCPKCMGWKNPHDALCQNCENTLRYKFRSFIDFLTAEEEEALDDMLDGRSVTEI